MLVVDSVANRFNVVLLLPQIIPVTNYGFPGTHIASNTIVTGSWTNLYQTNPTLKDIIDLGTLSNNVLSLSSRIHRPLSNNIDLNPISQNKNDTKGSSKSSKPRRTRIVRPIRSGLKKRRGRLSQELLLS